MVGRRVSFLELYYSRNWCQSCLSSSMHDGIVEDRELLRRTRYLDESDGGKWMQGRRGERSEKIVISNSACADEPFLTTSQTQRLPTYCAHQIFPLKHIRRSHHGRSQQRRFAIVAFLHTIPSANSVHRRKGEAPQSRKEREERTRRRRCRVPSQAERRYGFIFQPEILIECADMIV